MGDRRPEPLQTLQRFGADVEDGEREPRLDHVGGHGFSHGAEADEPDALVAS